MTLYLCFRFKWSVCDYWAPSQEDFPQLSRKVNSCSESNFESTIRRNFWIVSTKLSAQIVESNELLPTAPVAATSAKTPMQSYASLSWTMMSSPPTTSAGRPSSLWTWCLEWNMDHLQLITFMDWSLYSLHLCFRNEKVFQAVLKNGCYARYYSPFDIARLN